MLNLTMTILHVFVADECISPLTILRNGHVTCPKTLLARCHDTENPCCHVKFKKWPCLCVECSGGKATWNQSSPLTMGMGSTETHRQTVVTSCTLRMLRLPPVSGMEYLRSNRGKRVEHASFITLSQQSLCWRAGCVWQKKVSLESESGSLG